MIETQKYVGIPYRDCGRDALDGLDCYGLVRHVLGAEYGHDVPSYIGTYDSAEDSTSTHRAIRRALGDGRWQRVRADDAREGDVALLWLDDPARPSHIGVRVGPDALLHTRLATGAIVERLDGVLGQRVLGWWRWEAAALPELDQTPGDPVSIVAILVTIASAIPGASAIAGGVSALLGVGGLATAGVALGSLTGFGLFVAGATQLISIGAAIAGFGLSSRALRPDAPDTGVGGISPTLQGIGNTAHRGQVVPEVFGSHRLFPPAIGWYTEPGSDWIRILLAVGMGPVEMSAIHVGETPIGDLDGAEIEVRNGETTDAPLRGFSDNIIQSVPNIRYPMGIVDDATERVPVSDWSSATTAPDTERIGVGLHFPAGMYTFRKSGGTSIMWVRFDLEYRVHGTADWQPVPPLPRGLPQLPGSGSYRLPGTLAGGGTPRIPKKGTLSGSMVSRRSVYGDGLLKQETAAIPGGSASSWKLDSTLTRGFRQAIEWVVPKGRYDVRLRRREVDTAAQFVGRARVSEFVWSALRSYKPPSISPIDSSLLTGSRRLATLALRLRLSDQISGTLNRISVQVQRKLRACDPDALLHPTAAHEASGVWKGWTSEPVLTRSPAAAWRYLWERMLLQPLAPSQIDIAALDTWAAWCDAHQHRLDCVVDYHSVSAALARAIARAGRADLHERSGRVSVIVDGARSDVRQVLTPRNLLPGSFAWTRSQAHPPHAVRVQYTDGEANYDPRAEVVAYAPGQDANTATRFAPQVRLLGAMSRSAARARGEHLLAADRLRPNVFEVAQDREGWVAERGDRVTLSHDGALAEAVWARVVEIPDSETLVLDQALPASLASSSVKLAASVQRTTDDGVSTLQREVEVPTPTS